jgi:hypothetical protein
MSSEHPKNKVVELKGQMAEALNELGNAFGAKLKELSEYLHGLEKHEVHAILSASHHHPYYATLGLQYVPAGDIIDKPIKRGRKPNVAKKAAIRPAKATRKAVKTKFALSDVKATEYLKVIGKGEKSAKEIEKALKIMNASNAINYLKSKGLIKLSKQIGLKKFYKVA